MNHCPKYPRELRYAESEQILHGEKFVHRLYSGACPFVLPSAVAQSASRENEGDRIHRDGLGYPVLIDRDHFVLYCRDVERTDGLCKQLGTSCVLVALFRIHCVSKVMGKVHLVADLSFWGGCAVRSW